VTDFAHQCNEVVVFEEPTELRVTTGAASSSATVQTLPCTGVREIDEYELDGVVYNREARAGGDDYCIPKDAALETVSLEVLLNEAGHLEEDA